MILYSATDKKNNIYDENKIESILKECDVPFLNEIWQMLIKGKEEMTKISQPIEALQVLIIRISFRKIINLNNYKIYIEPHGFLDNNIKNEKLDLISVIMIHLFII